MPVLDRQEHDVVGTAPVDRVVDGVLEDGALDDRALDDPMEVPVALQPPRAFDEASRMVVDYLYGLAPTATWAVTRVADGRQTVLISGDDSGIDPGYSIPWADSFCRPMIAGEVPRIVADTHTEEGLTHAMDAASERSMSIGSYIGTPIVDGEGVLFGTVCGISDESLEEDLPGKEGLLDLLSSLLSAVLQADRAATESARSLERARSDAETDPLTGLLNRRGWERWLAQEEDRFRRFGDPASVVMLDLDQLKLINDTEGHDAGDRYIRATADTLTRSLRSGDALARLGGDEFAMVVRAGADVAERLVTRLERALEAAGVLGSFGYAPYTVVAGFPGACADADAAMYANKRARRALRA